jgi:transcriptional regulator with XRE-family HTH domain
MNAPTENFYQRIKEIRERFGLSQEDLANRMDIKRVTVSQIENGHRKICTEELIKLSRIFNITTDVLLNLDEDIEVVLEKSKKQKPKIKNEIRINVPQKNLVKFKEVLLYILEKVGSKSNIGESVLYKLLYFIDFNYYEKYEEQLIGATYIKNHYGPTPKEFIKIAEEMEGKDLVKIQDKYFKYPQTKYLPLRGPDLSKMSTKEQRVIDDVLNILSDMNAKKISEYSHQDVPWMTAEEGEVINYESVFYRTAPYSMREYSEEEPI